MLKHPWPKFDAELAKEEQIEIPVQVNGKLRSVVVVPADATEEAIREAATADEKVKSATAGKQIAKVIVVPRKLVSIVCR